MDLEIDHVIPEYLGDSARRQPELSPLLARLELPDDYNLNSADNLLPVHHHCNSRKGQALRDDAWLRSFRGIATDKVPMVLRLRERLKKQGGADKVLAEASSHVASGAFTAEYLYDSVTQPLPFSPKDDRETSEFIRASRSRVRIECKLPTGASPGGSALITFRPVEVRGVQVEVNHATLVRELFRGTHGPAVPRLRPFLEKPKGAPQVRLIRFGETSIRVGMEEVEQVCELLDALEPEYLRAFRAVEQAYRATDARLISPGQYEIARVSLPLWSQLVAFAKAHDLGDEVSEWHIFDSQCRAMLKLIERTPGDDAWDYRCFLDAVACRRDFAAWQHDPEIVSLRWGSLLNGASSLAGGAAGTRWSVERAMQFVYDGLIPKVVGGPLSWNSLWQWVSGASNEISAQRPLPHFEMAQSDFKTLEQAEPACSRLQELYIKEHDQFVSGAVISPLLVFLGRLLENHELPGWSIAYITEKLAWPNRLEIQSPLAFVKDRLAQVKNLEPSEPLMGNEADAILRSVLEVLGNGIAAREFQGVFSGWVRDLQPVLDDFNRRSYLQRLRAEDCEERDYHPYERAPS